jgi:arylsulfatase A-like enzyme
MNPAPVEQGPTYSHIRTGAKLGLAFGFIFALADPLLSTFRDFDWFRVEGVGRALVTELYSIAIYVPPVFILALIISIGFWLAKRFNIQSALRGYQEEILSGLFVCALFFIIFLSLIPPRHLWGIFLNSAAFLAAGLAAGAGAGTLTAWLKNRSPGHGPFLFFSVAALGGFAYNHVTLTALLLNTRPNIFVLIFAIGISALFYILFIWLGWRWLQSEIKPLRYIWSLVCLLMLLSPILAMKPEAREKSLPVHSQNPMNIIVIISDTCRADALGIYGGQNSTPNLDRMAEEGVLFKNAFSQAPWTLPSMLSAISSRYPSVLQRGRIYRIPASLTTFTEVLDYNGYFNKLLMGNYSLGKASGFVQGFDEYDVYFQFYRLYRLLPLPVFHKLHYLYRRFLDLPLFPDLTYTLTKKAVKFLASDQLQEPFFLWLHYIDPHDPYDPPDRFLKKSFNTQFRKPFAPHNPWHLRGDHTDPQDLDLRTGLFHLTFEDRAFLKYLYEAEVRYVDEKVGELLRLIEDKGLEERTLVVFTADHGEEFWEHDDWGHGQSLHKELIHVPLILWGARLPHKDVQEQVELIDLVPFMLELAGLAVPAEFQGNSFLGLIQGHPQASGVSEESRLAFSEATRHFEEMKAVQDGSYKLIFRQETSRYELYDMVHDAAETRNIYTYSHPEFERLDDELWPWADENLGLQKHVSGMDFRPVDDEEQERRLRALGYIK